MNLNLKLRLKNRVTLLAIVGTVLMIVYTLLGMIGITPSVTESQASDLAAMVVELLVLLGVVVDPTTAGVSDSQRAMTYAEPVKESDDE